MRRRGFLGAGLSLAPFGAVGGCSGFLLPSSRGPLRTKIWPLADDRRAPTLVVGVHGRGGSERDFDAGGFLGALRDSGHEADLLAVHAHAGYYKDRNLSLRLHEDVFEPARAGGYEKIVLVGASRGGLGALATLRKFPRDVDELVVFAPFMGPSLITDEIRAAGGLRSWEPKGQVEDIERIWVWLREILPNDAPVPMYLYWGEQDGFAADMKLLAEVWPEGQLAHQPGGHRWTTWTALWRAHLRRPGALASGTRGQA